MLDKKLLDVIFTSLSLQKTSSVQFALEYLFFFIIGFCFQPQSNLIWLK